MDKELRKLYILGIPKNSKLDMLLNKEGDTSTRILITNTPLLPAITTQYITRLVRLERMKYFSK